MPILAIIERECARILMKISLLWYDKMVENLLQISFYALVRSWNFLENGRKFVPKKEKKIKKEQVSMF
jgi:hypothetical protein